MTELLQLCDVVRDDTLPELGVRLEDHEGNRAESFNILSSKILIYADLRLLLMDEGGQLVIHMSLAFET